MTNTCIVSRVNKSYFHCSSCQPFPCTELINVIITLQMYMYNYDYVHVVVC